MTVTNKNFIDEEIKGRLNSGNNCYMQFRIFCLSVFFRSYKSVKIKIDNIINRYIVLYGCETWSLTLREEHRLRMCESRMFR
jgi:hypothetical protein